MGCEIKLKSKDNIVKYCQLTLAYHKPQSIKTANYIAIIKDLTQEIEIKKLQEAKIKTEAKNEELEKFVHIASHDLQEPLKNLQSINYLLKDSQEFNSLNNSKIYLEIFFDSINRMTELINDLLDYSRIGANERKVETNLNEVLEHCITDLT